MATKKLTSKKKTAITPIEPKNDMVVDNSGPDYRKMFSTMTVSEVWNHFADAHREDSDATTDTLMYKFMKEVIRALLYSDPVITYTDHVGFGSTQIRYCTGILLEVKTNSVYCAVPTDDTVCFLVAKKMSQFERFTYQNIQDGAYEKLTFTLDENSIEFFGRLVSDVMLSIGWVLCFIDPVSGTLQEARSTDSEQDEVMGRIVDLQRALLRYKNNDKPEKKAVVSAEEVTQPEMDTVVKYPALCIYFGKKTVLPTDTRTDYDLHFTVYPPEKLHDGTVNQLYLDSASGITTLTEWLHSDSEHCLFSGCRFITSTLCKNISTEKEIAALRTEIKTMTDLLQYIESERIRDPRCGNYAAAILRTVYVNKENGVSAVLKPKGDCISHKPLYLSTPSAKYTHAIQTCKCMLWYLEDMDQCTFNQYFTVSMKSNTQTDTNKSQAGDAYTFYKAHIEPTMKEYALCTMEMEYNTPPKAIRPEDVDIKAIQQCRPAQSVEEIHGKDTDIEVSNETVSHDDRYVMCIGEDTAEEENPIWSMYRTVYTEEVIAALKKRYMKNSKKTQKELAFFLDLLVSKQELMKLL